MIRRDSETVNRTGAAESSPAGSVAPRLALLFLAACGAAWLLDLLLLDEIPWAATIDDGAYAAAAYRFIHTGRAGLLAARGLFGLDRDLMMYGRIPAAFVGVAQLLGGTTPFASRIPSWMVVGVAAVLTFLFAHRCQLSAPLCWTATFLWLVSIPARLLAHSARPDSFFLIFTLAGVWMLEHSLRRDRAGPFFLTGVVAGLSLEAHMIGSALIATLGAATLLFSPPGRRWRNSVLLGLGVAPPALLWAFIHLFSQPDLWRLQWQGLWQHWAPVPLLGGPLAIVTSILRRYRDWFWAARYHRYLFEVPFLVAALAAGLRQGGPQRRLAGIVLLLHLSLALFSALPHAEYMFAVYPLLSVLMAARFFGSPGRLWRFAGLALFAFHLLQTGYWVTHRDPPLPSQVRADILRQVGTEAFLAADNLSYHFPDGGGLRSIVSVNFMAVYAPGLAWESAYEQYLRQENIHFLVADKVLERFLTPVQTAYFRRKGTLVQEYEYGRGRWIRIYRLAAN